MAVSDESRDLSPGRARRVLIVDDDPDARWIAGDALVEHGFEVTEAGDGSEAVEQFEARRPDLIVLDLGLPVIGGLDVLRSLREISDVPIILLTGRASQPDRVVGLELGADDYVVKPFDARELVARVNAVLRRGRSSHSDHRLEFGELTIDLQTRDVSRNGELIDLTAREFELLAFLASAPRQVFSRGELLEKVWGSSAEWQDPSTVNEHIHRLRRKIEPDPGSHRWIATLRGAGYRFTP
ncbi:MAG: response regulator [Acidimicrobiales bacterium]